MAARRPQCGRASYPYSHTHIAASEICSISICEECISTDGYHLTDATHWIRATRSVTHPRTLEPYTVLGYIAQCHATAYRVSSSWCCTNESSNEYTIHPEGCIHRWISSSGMMDPHSMTSRCHTSHLVDLDPHITSQEHEYHEWMKPARVVSCYCST